MMKTTHIFKSNCFMSTRIMMQSEWDQNCNFLHRKNNPNYHENTNDKKLSLFSIISFLLREKKENTLLIFHCQSSLPYLMISFIAKKLMNMSSLSLIYDIHDLHEYDRNEKGLIANLKAKIRYQVFRILERSLVKKNDINVMTVSEGIAEHYMNKFNIIKPNVVRNIGTESYSANENTENIRHKKDIVFFGRAGRIPFEIFQTCIDQSINLHLWGRGIEEAVEDYCKISRCKKSDIIINGAYEPNDLRFLDKFRYLILYKPNDLKLNYKFSLPNKLFQAISHGLSIIVSPNFTEIIDSFGHIPGAIIILNNQEKLEELIIENNKLRDEKFFSQCKKHYKTVRDNAKKNYQELCYCQFNSNMDYIK